FSVHHRSTEFGAPSSSLRPAVMAASDELSIDVRMDDLIRAKARRQRSDLDSPVIFIAHNSHALKTNSSSSSLLLPNPLPGEIQSIDRSHSK
ncbi:hypothetical protein ACLOJK_034855, partial [Asimina triloba]